MTEKLKNEPVRRKRLILKTELNSKNRVTAFSMVGILVITYSFNIIDWNLCKVKTKMMTTYSMHHPKADIHRLYLPRSNGGRDLSDDWMLGLTLKHKKGKGSHSVVKKAREFSREKKLDIETEFDGEMKDTKSPRKMKIIA